MTLTRNWNPRLVFVIVASIILAWLVVGSAQLFVGCVCMDSASTPASASDSPGGYSAPGAGAEAASQESAEQWQQIESLAVTEG